MIKIYTKKNYTKTVNGRKTAMALSASYEGSLCPIIILITTFEAMKEKHTKKS